jgi:hypothetical protein
VFCHVNGGSLTACAGYFLHMFDLFAGTAAGNARLRMHVFSTKVFSLSVALGTACTYLFCLQVLQQGLPGC